MTHAEKLKRIGTLLASPDVLELQALTAEVVAFEDEHYPVAHPTLSEAMRFRRQQMGETEEEISSRAGMTPQEWKRLESGDWTPSMTEAKRLHAIGIPASVILGQESPRIEVGSRVMVTNPDSCYAGKFGVVTGPNVPFTARWLVAIDQDPDFDEVSFHEAELRQASTSPTD